MRVNRLIYNAFQVNTYVIFDDTKEAIIIDPGMGSADEQKKMLSFLDRNGLKLTKIVNTHCHIDHILGVDFLKTKFGVKFYASKKDEYLFENLPQIAEMYGLDILQAPKIDVYLSENDEITFGNSVLKILEVPGHSTGHLAFYSNEDKFVITGDVLFKDTIGRTDLPGGNLDELMHSIGTKILPLGDDFTIFPGHGAETEIGMERKDNPFL